MSESSDVVTGKDATPAQYNNLRKDVRDPALGHDHEGTEGKILDGGAAITAGTITEDRLATALADKINDAMPKTTTKKLNFTTNVGVGLETVLDVSGVSGTLVSAFFRNGSSSPRRIIVTIDGVIIVDVASAGGGVSAVWLNSEGFLIESGAVVTDVRNVVGSTFIGWNYKTSLKIELDTSAVAIAFQMIRTEE